MSLLIKAKAEITAIETRLLAYLPSEFHEHVKTAVFNAQVALDNHAKKAAEAESEALYGGVDAQTSADVPATPTDPDAPEQGELPLR